MKIEYVNPIEGLEQIPTHSTERWIVNKTMWIDKADNAFSILFYIVFCQSYKLDIIVIEPFRITFFQLYVSTRFGLICFHKFHDPITLVSACSIVRRIANDDHNWFISFHLVSFLSLHANCIEESTWFYRWRFKGIGEKYIKSTVIITLVIACLAENHV